jgi:hypothetical protein
MSGLRRVLVIEAIVLAICGLALVIAPKFLIHTVFRQAPFPEYAWIRMGGIASFTLAMYTVLLARKVEDLWWWTWALVIGTGSVAVLCLLKAVFKVGSGSAPLFWWVLGLGAAAFTAALMWGLASASKEKPLQ